MNSKKNSSSSSKEMLDWKLLLLALVIFRIINALLINTFFDPDEYWQSLEVAHYHIYQYGYITWEWKEMIRSYLHPLLFMCVYKLLNLLSLDNNITIFIMAPKIFQGIMAAIGDLYLYRLSFNLFGSNTSKWTLICQLTSWYTFLCIVRTYSNSIEAILFIISLYYFPLPFKHQPNESNYKIFNNVQISMILVTIAFLIRPTTAIMWLYLIPLYIYYYCIKSSTPIRSLFTFIFRDVLLVAIPVLLISTFIDYKFYNQITFVPYNFLYFNVIKNVSSFYGTHPFHWYFTQGFPTISFTILPLFIFSIWKLVKENSKDKRLHLVWMTFFTIFMFSCLAHKEFRFILPILPVVMIYASYFIQSIYNQLPLKIIKSNNQSSSSTSTTSTTTTSTQLRFRNKPMVFILVLLALNVPMIMFFSNYHQSSPIKIMHYINDHISPLYPSTTTTTNMNQTGSIHFLMSCHATPYQSYVHNPNLKLHFLECPPPLYNQTIGADGKIKDTSEKAKFFGNPHQYLVSRYNQTPPSLVRFQSLDDPSLKLMPLPNYFIIDKEFVSVFNSTHTISKYYHLDHVISHPLDHTSISIYSLIKS